MACSEFDQNILLLQHDALTGFQRLRTLVHTRACPQCKERSAQFARVSSLMADAIRQHELPPRAFGAQTRTKTAPPRRRAAAPPLYARPRPAFTLMFAIFAVVVALAASVYRATALAPSYDAETTTATGAEACPP